ncbi:MAG TPA: hypothetical protein VNL95_01220 [Dehalococcoidia bacterium]|nr:hypothetical protein [Dehalococcoidia bacterium]
MRPRPARPEPAGEAVCLVSHLLARHRLEARPLAPGVLLVRWPGGQERLARVLARPGPHRRGGRGALGMHWLLPPGGEELVALADLGRGLAWLLTRRQFEAYARPERGGRYHLDWLVLPLGPSTLPMEEEFEPFLLGREGVPHPLLGGAAP